jgi:DNA-binding transcriptional MerR regulator
MSEHDAPRLFDIAELAALSGLQTSALRYYEREGLLRPAGRIGGRRVYDEQGLWQLAAISFWQQSGFTMKEMARLLGDSGGGIAEAKHIAEERIGELERLIDQATAMKQFLTHVLSCVHDRLGDCPQYTEHLRERADRIRAGEAGAWPRPTAVRSRAPDPASVERTAHRPLAPLEDSVGFGR